MHRMVQNFRVDVSWIRPHRVGLVVSMSASHAVGCQFTPRLGHTKDHHKIGTVAKLLASPRFFNCKLKLSGLNYNGSQCTVHKHINAGEKNKNAYINCTIRILLCYNSI